jgi:hypothetical protein
MLPNEQEGSLAPVVSKLLGGRGVRAVVQPRAGIARQVPVLVRVRVRVLVGRRELQVEYEARKSDKLVRLVTSAQAGRIGRTMDDWFGEFGEFGGYWGFGLVRMGLHVRRRRRGVAPGRWDDLFTLIYHLDSIRRQIHTIQGYERYLITIESSDVETQYRDSFILSWADMQ